MSQTVQQDNYKKVKTILIALPKPVQKSPYFDLIQKYGLEVDFRQFVQVDGMTAKDFRKQKIRLEEYSSFILISRNAVDHLFRLCEEMRVKLSPDTKYFCVNESISNYLQKFILFRKRKVFAGVRSIADMLSSFNKHKDKEKFLLPLSNIGSPENTNFLRDNKIEFQEAIMYNTVSSDLSDLRDITYDILAFFSPFDIKSLYDNFPDFKQNETRIAAFGASTIKAAEEKGLFVNIQAPSPELPSMPMAIEKYLHLSNKE